jgi:hypothetical protein
MKKNFPLQEEGRDAARVRDRIRQEINKYVRRERRKKLPEGFALWEFNCRVGVDRSQAEPRGLKELGGEIERIAQDGATEVYVEIVSVPANRPGRS